MKIDTIAALKRIEPGTKLYVVHSFLGPNEPKLREFLKARSQDVIFKNLEEGSKSYGNSTYLTLTGVKVEPTEKGFRVIEKEDPTLFVEYVFA